ncbi:hypothetical protein TrLO_g13369, partial [Triparma laevis f. longispina]
MSYSGSTFCMALTHKWDFRGCTTGVPISDSSPNSAYNTDVHRNLVATPKTNCDSSCTSCGAGKFLSDAGEIASKHNSAYDCAVCGAGKWSGSAASASCTSCEAGKYLGDAGVSAIEHDSGDDCKICSAGVYQVTTGAASCTGICGAGKY